MSELLNCNPLNYAGQAGDQWRRSLIDRRERLRDLVPDMAQRANRAGERDAQRSHGPAPLTGRLTRQAVPVNLCECDQPRTPRTSSYPERWCSPGCAGDYLARHVRPAVPESEVLP